MNYQAYEMRAEQNQKMKKVQQPEVRCYQETWGFIESIGSLLETIIASKLARKNAWPKTPKQLTTNGDTY